MRLFSMEGFAYHACVWVYNLALTSLLFVVLCLPVVTVPASAAALFGVSRRLLRDENPPVFASFFRMFAENFWQSMACGWMLAAAGAFLAVDYRIAGIVHTAANPLVLGALWLATLVWLFVALHLFPLMVHMRMTILQLFASAFKLSLYRGHLTLANLAVLFVAFELSLRFSLTLFLFFPGAAALVTYWFADRKFRALQAAQEARAAAQRAEDGEAPPAADAAFAGDGRVE